MPRLEPPRRPPRQEPRAGRRSPGAIAVSVVLHGALLAFLAQALELRAPIAGFFVRREAPPPAERVTYVEPRVATSVGTPAPEGGGDGRPQAPPPARPMPRAPLTVPDGVPAPSPASEPPIVTAPAPTTDAGRGTGRGTGVGELTGPAAGLRPTYTGSAVWLRPEWEHARPANTAERLDSLIAVEFEAVRDSMVAAANARKPGDWTFERNGQKWGMDQKYIRLGRFSIPTAILGLMPLNNVQANPSSLERQRRLEPMYQESQAQTVRRRNDADFDDIVKSIRERRDRERAERRAKARADSAALAAPPRDR